MPRHIDIGTAMPFTAQEAALKITKNQAIRIWEDLNRTREELAAKNYNLDAAIYDAAQTIRKLATIERALGYDKTRNWFEGSYDHALKVLQAKEDAA